MRIKPWKHFLRLCFKKSLVVKFGDSNSFASLGFQNMLHLAVVILPPIPEYCRVPLVHNCCVKLLHYNILSQKVSASGTKGMTNTART